MTHSMSRKLLVMKGKESMEKILVPVDGSRSSIKAEETAARIAGKTGATVTVFHVMQELVLGDPLPRNIHDELMDSIEQHARLIETNALSLFREEKVKAETKRTLSNDPAESILNLSEKDPSLIVMGASGEGMLDPYALGSVTKKVVRHATHPMLIAKEVTDLLNILVCIDGSKNSFKALSFAAELAAKMGSNVTLLSIVDKRIYDHSPKAAEKAGQAILSRALKTLGKKKLKTEKKLEFGSPSETIVRFAEKGNHDLIVVGSRGLGTVDRFLLGSVSDHVINRAKCSVLVVPAKG